MKEIVVIEIKAISHLNDWSLGNLKYVRIIDKRKVFKHKITFSDMNPTIHCICLGYKNNIYNVNNTIFKVTTP